MREWLRRVWLQLLVSIARLGSTWLLFVGGAIVSAAINIITGLLYSTRIGTDLPWVLGASAGLFFAGAAVTIAAVKQSEASKIKDAVFTRSYLKIPPDKHWTHVLTKKDDKGNYEYGTIVRLASSMGGWIILGVVLLFASLVALVAWSVLAEGSSAVPTLTPRATWTPSPRCGSRNC